jgi:transcriptional regulator with GAF, ATPase, and Fis domain
MNFYNGIIPSAFRMKIGQSVFMFQCAHTGHGSVRGGGYMEDRHSFITEDLLKSHVSDVERHIIASVLRRTGGNQAAAARQLGTTEKILRHRIRKYGIDVSQFCNPEKHLEK